MNMGPKIVNATLLYLFHYVETKLDGRPTLLLVDEAWLALSNPLFSDKLREWLKVLRKNNCAVVMATQSLSDVVNSPIRDAVFESCPTRLLLPNPEAQSAMMKKLYQEYLRLDDAQIALIASAEKKRHYYYASPTGTRLFELNLGPASLSFLGASSKPELAAIRRLAVTDPEGWPAEWLEERAYNLRVGRKNGSPSGVSKRTRRDGGRPQDKKRKDTTMNRRRWNTGRSSTRWLAPRVTFWMVLLSLTSASDARAGILAGGASEVTQVLNKVELIMQTKKIVDQVRQTKQTLQLLKNNFQRLNPASWGQFTGALNLLADSVKQGERTAFALARADEEYERRFALASGSGERPARFSHAYQGWWKKNRASVRDILAKVGMKASDFRNQQAGLRKLQNLSRSPGSRDQILQAANELAVTQSRQLQELQEIGMQQIALQGTTFTAEQEQIHHEREATRRALKTPRLYRGNEKKY